MPNTESDKSDREINPDYPWDNYEPLENDFFLADRLNNTIIRINEDKDGTRFDSGGYGTSGELSADGTKVILMLSKTLLIIHRTVQI